MSYLRPGTVVRKKDAGPGPWGAGRQAWRPRTVWGYRTTRKHSEGSG